MSKTIESKLVVQTVRLSTELAIEQLIDFLPSEQPLAFVRGGSGIIGFGETLRLETTGADRMATLAAQWSAIAEQAKVDNQLSWPGTGLVAFGSMAFADDSSTKSVLVIPKFLLGKHDGELWFTTIARDDQPKNALTWQEVFKNSSAAGSETFADLHQGFINREQFVANVEKALKEIAETGLQKVVLARDAVASLSEDFDIRTLLRNLNERFQTCWIYCVDGTVGASPELLVRVSHGQVSARVLAGTAGRGTDPGIDQVIASALMNSEKNVKEHEFAVKSLVESLQPFCTQVDADEKPFSLALPNVWHLASDVHGVLRQGASSLNLAAALHPTAAVAGTPRNLALDFIAQTEALDRGRYAAPVGWISASGDGEWAIALRGAQLTKTVEGKLELHAFAGCGVVAGSTPEAELAETSLKFAPIRDALS